ncbi:urease accessory protein UreD [Massilia sp. CCM 9210]|uniref:urease accessory protein UreD n=1 Tax=Massilia scottii TaxID=3057166 RepID=UPI002796D616|nr:urease accessory protein UreD [Massilia sp. CCM 9210]MDQ1811778.1 urease accessory protein UreD [Massilia sp. CCM 9210]
MRDCHQTDPTQSAWQASLRLRFADDAGTTRLLERIHSGPLRVQKPLYPEGPRICHAIVVHPPGGVVGGDRLAVGVAAGDASHAFLTSPGAAKWYRANGKISRQDVLIEAGAGAAVEWMPQEAIFFNGAHVALEQRVELAANACYIGCDILCFGRRASGETFDSGTITQHTQIRRGGKLLWWEQGALHGGSAAMHSPLGLNGASVCATLVGVGKPAGGALIDAMRALDPALGITQIKSVFVARYLGNDSEGARRAIFSVWQLLRPHLLGCAAPLPRIWTT